MSTTVRAHPYRARQRISGRQQWRLTELLSEDRWTQTFAAQPERNDQGSDFVVKLARQDLVTDYDRQLAHGLLLREGMISRLVRHRHLAATLEVHRQESGIWLVQPRLAGSLPSTVHDLPLSQKLWILRQISEALAALHAAGWLHGNVSAAAILVASSGQATLGNLGWCRQLGTDECDLARTAFIGELRSAAPEMLDDAGLLTPAADVYSLGVLLVELLTGRPPLAQYDGPELVAAKRLLSVSSISSIESMNLPFEVRSLAARILSRDALRRPTVAEVIQALVAAEIGSFG